MKVSTVIQKRFEACDEQIYYHVCVDTPFDTAIPRLHHFFPDGAIAALGDESFPSSAAKSVFALLGPKLDDGVEEGQVEAPDFYPCSAACPCDWSQRRILELRIVLRLFRGFWCNDGLNGREGFW